MVFAKNGVCQKEIRQRVIFCHKICPAHICRVVLVLSSDKTQILNFKKHNSTKICEFWTRIRAPGLGNGQIRDSESGR